MFISAEGLTKEEVLVGLYENSKPLGYGFLHFDPKPMTQEEATKIIEECVGYFDYVKGHVMKFDFETYPLIECSGYDRDNGDGAMQRVIDELLESKKDDN